MTIRALRLPGDLLPLADMLVKTFQYPENPEWGIQADEEDDIAREIKTLRRLWPLFRVAQFISKPLKDIFRGFLWEEDGKIGAVVITQRQGSSNTWTVGTVGVLPEFRRRGLAKQLLTKSLEDIRRRGGTHIVLGVIDRNVPAYTLYRSLGFEHYSSQLEFQLAPKEDCEKSQLPKGFTEVPLDKFDWEKRYTLAKRVTPVGVAKYRPVEEGRFKTPAAFRLIEPLMSKMQRRREKRSLFRVGDMIVGHSGYRTTTSQKGTSTIWAYLDPEQPNLAPHVIGEALRSVTALSPSLRVRLMTSSWMPSLGQTATELGFTKRLEYHELGLIL
ncbi:GNAT family N-acetyltransferase [Candidatus Bipolaricaulota bacterium]